MSNLKASNSGITGESQLNQSLAAQSATLTTKTNGIIELTDEQLSDVAGGSQGYTAVDESCFPVDDGGFASGSGGFAVDEGCFSVGNSGFAIDEGCFSI